MKAKPTNRPGELVLELNRRDEALMAAASGEVTPSPFRLKKILVPIHFSDCSKKALLLAVFVGLNLIQSGFTGFCPAEIVLKKLGVGRGCCSTTEKTLLR